jgi:type IV pilus assembly protein PilX
MRAPPSIRRERGASLLVAMVFLVIMAMLGVTVANVTSLQERMAGHTRDRDLALQSGEAALQEAESRISDATFRAGAIAFDPLNANDDAFWETCFAGTAGACATKYSLSGAVAMPTSGAGAVAAQPQYVLERKPDIGTTQIFRVTARSVGGTQDAIVILQAEFGYTP